MNLSLNVWNENNYTAFRNFLLSKADNNYKNFHMKLVPGLNNLIGIPIPEQRKMVKEILKGNALSFISFSQDLYYEETMIRGLVIGGLKIEYELFVDLVDGFLDSISNWGICDSFSTALKSSSKFESVFFTHVLEYLNSENQWHIRTGLVILLAHFLKPDKVNHILNMQDKISSKEYYVQMAQAWLVSTCYIKFPDETLNYLLNHSTLDTWTYNKSISKICDSRRVSSDVKTKLKQLRR